jgi:16S rRNA (cytosine967-C5)-methyltransferase
MPASPARIAAYDILLRVERERAYADELLHSALLNNLSAADRGLCTEIVMGVLRWRARLDFAIEKLASRAVERLDLEVLIALRMGLYQIQWLERVPARAAVNESVELVKRARKRSAVAFANAVLRKAKPGSPDVPPAHDDASLALEWSHPEWLVERWVREYGFDVARRICEFDQQVPETVVRVADDAAEQELIESGVSLTHGRLVSRARIVEQGDVAKTRAFTEGRVHFQDEGSQLVALLVGRGRRVLDCCAAPGGKTMVMAERNPEAEILAAELHEHRARSLSERVHAKNVSVVTADVRDLPLSGDYDRVLADVPCSGTGTLARNPEIKWKLNARDVDELHKKQAQILRSALQQVKAGGRAVYSTCSLEREECESVVEEVVREQNDFRTVPVQDELGALQAQGEIVGEFRTLVRGDYLRTIPGVQRYDGFFAAVIERRN